MARALVPGEMLTPLLLVRSATTKSTHTALPGHLKASVSLYIFGQYNKTLVSTP